MLAEVRSRRTVASYFLRPSRLRATLDIPLLSLPRASVAPAFYLVRPPGVAALREQDSWYAVGTTPSPSRGPSSWPRSASTPHPESARSYLPGEVTVRSLDSNPWIYGAQSHIPRGGVL